jgi:hypothetical protein
MSDSEDEMWHTTYPKTISLLVTPVGQAGVTIAMTTETRLPHSHRAGKGQYFTINNDLSVSYNGNRYAVLL